MFFVSPPPASPTHGATMEVLRTATKLRVPHPSRFLRRVGSSNAAYPTLCQERKGPEFPIRCTPRNPPCAAFIKESRMKCVGSPKPNRKFGFWGTRRFVALCAVALVEALSKRCFLSASHKRGHGSCRVQEIRVALFFPSPVHRGEGGAPAVIQPGSVVTDCTSLSNAAAVPESPAA